MASATERCQALGDCSNTRVFQHEISAFSVSKPLDLLAPFRCSLVVDCQNVLVIGLKLPDLFQLLVGGRSDDRCDTGVPA